jgi:hypothetical protein
MSLKESGVSVEVPSLDDNSETITLRGEQDKLGPALTMVYSKVRTYLFCLTAYHISIEHQRHCTQFVFSIEIVMLHVPSVII